jgi:tetratricopeptide (TPR) repeat protein
VLARHPRDALALQVANTFDYLTGHAARMLARVEAAWPAWSADLPGYGAMLTSHAFALEECGHYAHAEETARLALEIDPLDIRAHHVMAHVFEMTDRPADGVRWMTQHAPHTGADRLFSTHCWWHLALFHLALAQTEQALTIHDSFVEAGSPAEVADLIDAAALLWRIRLQGGSVGPRAVRLADAWAPHIDDGFCTFSDIHAMLAFVAADDWVRAERLMANLTARRSTHTGYDRVSSQIGVPVCRALMAFGRGDPVLATTLLASLPAQAHRLGGSHAQRDVLNLTLMRAIEGIRRPARAIVIRPAPVPTRLRPAPAPAARLPAASPWRA